MKDLFGDEEFDWKKEWQGMPEFEQTNLKTIHSVVVNFIYALLNNNVLFFS